MKQITINNKEMVLNTNKETIISLNIGDKINVNGLLKDYQPYYDMENLILINPETGQKIIIQNVNNVFENNDGLLDFDLNKLTDIYSNKIPESYSYVSFLDDPEEIDNIIDKLDVLLNYLEEPSAEIKEEIQNDNLAFNPEDLPAPAAGEEPTTEDGIVRARFEDRTALERNIETDLRSNSLNETNIQTTTNLGENNLNLVEDTIPLTPPLTPPLEEAKEIEVSYVNVNNTLYEKVTIPTIAVEVDTETSVLNEELIESEGLILIEEQWYKPTIKEKEETFTDYRTEIIRTETPYEPYNSIGIEYNNLNNYGDTTENISFGHLVNDISIQIKSFKVDFDEGVINFYKEGELVNSSYIDEYYDSKDNIETMLNIKTDFDYDTLSITHNGEAQGVGQQSGEFKIGGIIENNVFDTIVSEEEVQVPFENTRIVEVEENILYEGDVYKTIVETHIEYVENPNFDTTNLIKEGGEWYQPVEDNYLKVILSGGDEEEYFNLDNLIDNVEKIELTNNININLDDLLTSDKYYGDNIEIKIITDEGEEIGISDNITTSNNWNETIDNNIYTYENYENGIKIDVFEQIIDEIV